VERYERDENGLTIYYDGGKSIRVFEIKTTTGGYKGFSEEYTVPESSKIEIDCLPEYTIAHYIDDNGKWTAIKFKRNTSFIDDREFVYIDGLMCFNTILTGKKIEIQGVRKTQDGYSRKYPAGYLSQLYREMLDYGI
jgi:hypothetical protein